MIIISNDYWRSLIDQKLGVKPLDKVEIELSAGTWTDLTDYYLGGATFDQEKERAPDKISAGDTRYSFDNTEDTFTDTDSGSIFYGVIYHGKRIRFSIGFTGIGFFSQSIMIVKDVKWDFDEQRCYIYCQETMQRLIDEELNTYPSGLVAGAGAGNTGNGTITEIFTMPFAVVSNGWTLTCDDTTNGGAGTFDVVKDGVGSIGTATMGVEFTDTTHGIKFTITEGSTPFALNDEFTFTAYQYPEYTTINPVKAIWNLITGYDYDSDVQSDWHDRVIELDHTQSDANPDINYNSFVKAIASVDNNLTGYIPYNQSAALAIENIIIHFLGAIYTDNKGRVSISAFKPTFGGVLLREFSDDKKVFAMDSEKDTAQIINKASVFLKRSASWAWSNDDEVTDDVYTNEDATSITNYGLKNPFTWTDSYWYSASKAAQKWFIDRLVDKFGKPPIEIKFETGLDAIRTNLASTIKFTDSRTSYDQQLLEVIKINKDFESVPKQIKLEGSDTGTSGVGWIFLGSSEDEGDGISPQNASWDSASSTDKQFCYLSQTGGEGSDPEYYLF